MLTLFHHPLFAGCRFVRLSFGEYGEELSLIEEKPWNRRKEFLLLNPAGNVPVLLAEGDEPIVGATVIAEYVDETRGALKRDKRLLAEDPIGRAEIRRLVDWYLEKTESEVTRHLVRERVLKPIMASTQGGGSPDSAAIRAARANVKQHLKYTNWLAGTRNWLAGDRITYADLAAEWDQGQALATLRESELPGDWMPSTAVWFLGVGPMAFSALEAGGSMLADGDGWMAEDTPISADWSWVAAGGDTQPWAVIRAADASMVPVIGVPRRSAPRLRKLFRNGFIARVSST